MLLKGFLEFQQQDLTVTTADMISTKPPLLINPVSFMAIEAYRAATAFLISAFTLTAEGNGKGKVRPGTGHEGSEGE
jgi:hypothetical protein